MILLLIIFPLAIAWTVVSVKYCGMPAVNFIPFWLVWLMFVVQDLVLRYRREKRFRRREELVELVKKQIRQKGL